MGKLQHILLCCLAFIFCCSFHCSAQSTAEKDVLLNVLQEKFSELYTQYANQRIPCYALSFSIRESQDNTISVNLGHVQSNRSDQNHRELCISIVVGNHETNNFQKKNCEKSYCKRLPITNDKVALGKLIDETMLYAYKKAVSEYNDVVRYTLFDNVNEPVTLDFPSDTFHYEPPLTSFNYNKEEVMSKLLSCTQSYAPIEEIDEFEGYLTFYPERTYYVNNFGAVIVYNTTSCDLRLTMRKLSEKKTITYAVDYPDDLPPIEQLLTDATTLYNQIGTPKNADGTPEVPLLPRHYENGVEPAEFLSDVIFKAMQDEINDNLNLLNINDTYQPYYISYLVTDAHLYHVSSVLGCTTHADEKQERFVQPTIRIGNNIINNEHLSSSYYDSFGSMTLDNDYNALRNDIRTITADVYKEAVDQYIQKQQEIQERNVNINALMPNRSAADIKTNIQYENYSKIDIGELQSITDGLSALFLQESVPLDIATNTTVSLYIHQGNAYYLSCERVQYAQSVSVCMLELSYRDINAVMYFNTLDDIINRDSITRWTETFIRNICQQEKENVCLESYAGPVVLTGAAAGEWFSQAGMMLTTAYNRHEFLDKGLEQFIDKRICSPILDIQSIDHTQNFNGTQLIGSFTFDAEGVIVNDNMEIIRRGRLITLLNDRHPVEKILYSNGHQRLNIKFNHYGTSIGPGVLKVNSRNTLSDTKFYQLFLQKAKESGYEYAYIINDFYRDWLGGIKAVAQKISIKDGKIIGVSFMDVDENALWSLRNVIASTNQTTCYNTMSSHYDWFDYSHIRGIPTSVIYPESLLFDHLTIRSKSAVNKK